MPEVLQQMLNYVIAIYIRLSAEDGDLSDEKSESNSVVNQRAYIRRFIELRPEFAEAQILEFCDDGYSGTNMERPAVRRLLEQVRQRKINCIIVKDMSRFGRDYIVVGDYLEQIFPFLDVRFIAINDSYDSKDHKYGSAGLIDVSFRNVIYDLYSKDLSEKVRSTKKQLAEKGYCVAPYAFFGYQKAPGNKHTLLVDEDAAAVVRRVFDLFISGLSTTEIARKFNAEGVLTPLQRKRLQAVSRKWNCVDQNKNYWTSSIVRKILDDERYTGKAIYGKTTRKKVGSSRVKAVTEDQWTVVDGAFPAIITQEIFDTAKSLGRSFHLGTTGKSARIFYRKIRCGHCGLAMERLQSSHPCYVCRTDRYKPDIGCPQDKIGEKELEQAVLASIRTMAQLVRRVVQAKRRQSAKDTRYNQRLDRQIKAHQNSIQMRQQEKMAAFKEFSAFCGYLKCPECGGNLTFHFNQGNHDIKFFSCNNHNSGLRKCSSTHYIRLDFLEQVVLYEIHRLACFANEYENDFIKAMVGRSAKVAENDRVRKKRELDGLLARDRELDMLFERLYEDNVSGKIDDARFAKMSKRYEQEQGENAGRIKALRLELKKLEDKRMDVDTFLETVRRYTDATTITKRMVAELIQYIEVYPAVKEDGITNQRVTIHYNCIGAFEVPDRRKIPERDILLETRKGVALSYAPTQIAI